jgi:hypothetical protein
MKEVTRKGARIVTFLSIFELFALSDDNRHQEDGEWTFGQDRNRQTYFEKRMEVGRFQNEVKIEMAKDKDLQYLFQLGHTLRKQRHFTYDRGIISIPRVIQDKTKYRKTKKRKLKIKTIRIAFCPTLSWGNSSGRLEECGKELIKVVSLLEMMGINYSVDLIFGFKNISGTKTKHWILRTKLAKRNINIVRHAGMTRFNSYGWCHDNVPECSPGLGTPFDLGELAERFKDEFDLVLGTARPGEFLQETIKILENEHFKKANSREYTQARDAAISRAGNSQH